MLMTGCCCRCGTPIPPAILFVAAAVKAAVFALRGRRSLMAWEEMEMKKKGQTEAPAAEEWS